MIAKLLRRVNYKLTTRLTHRGLSAFIEDHLAKIAARGGRPRILNIGAGGVLGRRIEARRDVFEVTSVDLDPARGPDVVASFTDLAPFADASVDAVFAMEVLEHVTDPNAAVAAAHRVLVPGGLFVASTPFLMEQHDVPADYYRFTRFGIEHLVREFREHTIVARGGYFSSSLVPLLRLSHRESLRDLSVGTAAVAMTYALYPAVVALDLWIESTEATTGFAFVATK